MATNRVIVIGAGHAGVEAANAAARLGVDVFLITSSIETVGQMSCNPAIGGVAKGTVVREVDAMGGVMGRAADQATIQFRMLNRSKGPAVWSPRAQCDRGLYRRAVRSLIDRQPNLSLIQGTVKALKTSGGRVSGVTLTDGREFEGESVVLTAGTFLRGKIHIGTGTQIEGGRAGDAAVVDLAVQLDELGLQVERFKTGTPPRIDGRTVDYSKLERQDGDDSDYRFSQFDRNDRPEQVPCWITWAEEPLKLVIQEHLADSALYGGALSGRGPRYCPSIEDKIVKFPDADRHQIFLEPEGLDTSELYVNGLSTSLPIDVQVKFLQQVTGLENAVMTRPGYAIEYDYFPPSQLTPWLEVRELEGLFFAGQINGTTGYEEAAGQGLIAGINAARRVVGREAVVLGRDDGYIGVLIDDLVTRGVDEPYRLFTSRAEYRLLLRQDNALKRLGPLASELGLLSTGELAQLERRAREEEDLISEARSRALTPDEVADYFEELSEAQSQEKQLVSDLVRRPRATLKPLLKLAGYDGSEISDDAWTSAQVELKYEGYLARERAAAKKLAEMADFRLAGDLPYGDFRSLSTEARQKLSEIRPVSLAQAGRIPGVSPSDLQNLVFEVMKRNKNAA